MSITCPIKSLKNANFVFSEKPFGQKGRNNMTGEHRNGNEDRNLYIYSPRRG